MNTVIPFLTDHIPSARSEQGHRKSSCRSITKGTRSSSFNSGCPPSDSITLGWGQNISSQTNKQNSPGDSIV